MDIRAADLGTAPFTDSGELGDCAWQTKAAIMGAFDNINTENSQWGHSQPRLQIAALVFFFACVALIAYMVLC